MVRLDKPCSEDNWAMGIPSFLIRSRICCLTSAETTNFPLLISFQIYQLQKSCLEKWGPCTQFLTNRKSCLMGGGNYFFRSFEVSKVIFLNLIYILNGMVLAF